MASRSLGLLRFEWTGRGGEAGTLLYHRPRPSEWRMYRRQALEIIDGKIRIDYFSPCAEMGLAVVEGTEGLTVSLADGREVAIGPGMELPPGYKAWRDVLADSFADALHDLGVDAFAASEINGQVEDARRKEDFSVSSTGSPVGTSAPPPGDGSAG